MPLQVNVRGGTGAGRRRVRERPRDWVCPSCSTNLKYHWTACPVDGTPRPDQTKEN